MRTAPRSDGTLTEGKGVTLGADFAKKNWGGMGYTNKDRVKIWEEI